MFDRNFVPEPKTLPEAEVEHRGRVRLWDEDDDLAPARGILVGTAISAIGWIVAALVIALVLAGGIASARAGDPRPPCAKHDVVVAALKHLGEELVSARTWPDGVGEVYATPSGSTWSGAFVRPDGWTCLVVHGRDLVLTSAPETQIETDWNRLRPYWKVQRNDATAGSNITGGGGLRRGGAGNGLN